MTVSYGRAVPLLLLIEPHSDEPQAVCHLLAGAPDLLAVELVRSVDEGCRRLVGLSVSAVLLDLSLPEARDLTAIDRIRQAAPNVAILVLAGAGDQWLARRALERGATDYVVTGQLDTRQLCQLVAMMFERRGLEQQRFVERERAEITLNSIGDAVLTTDTAGCVTYLNGEAEALTGWTRAEAFARPLAEVLDVTDSQTGQPIDDPARLAMTGNCKIRLAGHQVLAGRDHGETAIELSAAPIHERHGETLGAVLVFRDVVVSREHRRQMMHLAEHDPLTGLPNRLLFSDRLARSVALARRHGRRLAVLFVDCDRFKQINDTHGHQVGDAVLCSVARRLMGCVRESDTVSRHGGDEFVILLTELDQTADAATIAEKVVQCMGETHVIGDRELSLSVSVGVSLYPEDGQNAAALIERADAAMYHAKCGGRNGVMFYDHDRPVPPPR